MDDHIGKAHETFHQVESRHLASVWGSGRAEVLATPALVAFCEACARLLVEPLLEPEQQTVGTRIELQHLAATPPGMTVRVRAELVAVEGRRLSFSIEAWDEIDQVGQGRHERFIVDAARFERRITEKRSRLAG
jgi:predicted thioesterase